MEMFYNKDGIKVRRATKKDAEYLSDKLRQSDIDEVWASNNYTPKEALSLSLEKSIFAATVENGYPIGIFGIVPDDVLGDKACVWFLASNKLDDISIKFLKQSKKFILFMLSYYPLLYNYVDCRNTKSIEWLKYCGAIIEDPKPFGVEGKPFRRFYFEKRDRKNI